MKWLVNLINWFKGASVRSGGKLVKNAKPNAAFAKAMQQTQLVLETPNGKKWLQSLSIGEFNTLKKQIAANKITASQLNGKILAYNFPEVSKFAKLLRTDIKLQTQFYGLPKNIRAPYIDKLKKGTATAKDVFEELQQKIAPGVENFKIVQGVAFSNVELQQLNKLTTELANGGLVAGRTFTLKNIRKAMRPMSARAYSSLKNKGQQYTKLNDKHQYSYSDIQVHVITTEEAITKYNKTKGTRGFARPTHNEIYLIVETIHHYNPKTRWANIDHVLTHEIAHIKDPALLRSFKLGKTYNSRAAASGLQAAELMQKNAPANWYKNYYFHQFEVVANNAPILKTMTLETQEVVKTAGKAKTLDALNEISNWIASGTPATYKFKNPDCTKILGYRKIEFGVKADRDKMQSINMYINEFQRLNPAGYTKLVKLLARQVEALKQQVKDTKYLTPESKNHTKTRI
jgi:hypothetical protein